MVDHKIEKPVIFISHATSDAEFANAVKQEIENVFADGVSVFCTSSPGAIPVGNDWLLEVEQKLAKAQTIIALITPTSIERPWLWFEIGATWANGRNGNARIIPLCTSEISLSELPSPLDRLQALSIGKAPDLKLLFGSLIEQFGFGKLTSFKASNITSRIPKYKNVKIKDVDLNEKAFYTGKYTGYSDEDLIEVIDANLFTPNIESPENLLGLGNNREDYIPNGKLLHFKEIDMDLGLPPSTSKRLLNKVAMRHNLIPELETDNVIRYKYKK